MSAVAPPPRSRRGARQYLPLVLGLAFLAVTIGAEYGDAPSSAVVRPAVIGQPAAVSTPVGWAGHERVAAAPARDCPGWQHMEAVERSDPAGDHDRSPVWVLSLYAQPVPDGQPVAARIAVTTRSGVVPATGGPRAPPRPVV
jgi:hypothetical protein